MLKISGPGWAEISIAGNVVFEGSYLTDIPCDFLRALYDYFSYNCPDHLNSRQSASVYVDSEGSVANFVFSDMFYSGNGQKVFMMYPKRIKDGEAYKTIWAVDAFDVDPYDLAVELINDIESDFENWVEWEATDVVDSKNRLSYWLEKLKSVTKDEKPYAEKLKAWNTPGTPENDEIEKVRQKAIENLQKEIDAIPYDHIEKHFSNNED